ncbi:MAG: (2Fe-2S) ferredoxin domain-containing protein [Bacteroidales bacterium]|jgi:NADP-reducing hydrogenase subunit HndB
MGKIKTIDELRKLKNDLVEKQGKSNAPDMIKIKVAMATCCIASGSKNTIEFINNELLKRNIDALVTQTGCMGYCYAEPTVEVTIPGKEPVIFGYVDEKKADEIIEKYIRGGELVEGIIPLNYKDIEDTV